MSISMNRAQVKALLEESAGVADSSDPKQRKRRRIVDIAWDLFSERGYRTASVDEVARRAGVAKGTVYLYFPSKAHLLVAAIAAEKLRFESRIGPLFDDDMSPPARLREWLRLSLVIAQEMPLVSRLMHGDHEILHALEDLAHKDPELIAKSAAQGERLIHDMIEEAAPGRFTAHEIDERAQALRAFVLFAGLMDKPQVLQGLTVERLAELLSQMLADGLVHGADASDSPSGPDSNDAPLEARGRSS